MVITSSCDEYVVNFVRSFHTRAFAIYHGICLFSANIILLLHPSHSVLCLLCSACYVHCLRLPKQYHHLVKYLPLWTPTGVDSPDSTKHHDISCIYFLSTPSHISFQQSASHVTAILAHCRVYAHGFLYNS